MKYKTTFLWIFTLIVLGHNAFSQILFTEDFETGELGVFTAFDLDKNTIDTDESWIKSGTWENNPFLLGNNATSTSNYLDNGQPDNWMVSTAIKLPNTTGISLYWKESGLGGKEGYEVVISTSNVVESFTDDPIYSTDEAAGGGWHPVSSNLDDYAGQTIYIGYHHLRGTQGYIYIDDIQVAVESVQYNMSVSDIFMADTQRLEERTIRGVVENLASAIITDFDINYQINGGDIHTSSVTNVELYNDNSFQFEHAISWIPSSVGDYTIKVWASNLNGNEDEVPSNDAFIQSFTVVEGLPKKVMLEVFTSSTCGPCAYYTERTEDVFAKSPFYNNNNKEDSRLNVVKFHVDIPTVGDPSVNSDAQNRQSFYSVRSAPSPYFNGTLYPTVTGDVALWEIVQEPTYVSMGIQATYGMDDELNIDVSINPEKDYNESYVLHIVATNLYYEFDGQNGETYFKNTVRKMLPSTDGSALNKLTEGVEQNISASYNYTVSNLPKIGSFDFWDLDFGIVAFIQNTKTKEIIQSVFIEPSFVSAVNILEEINQFYIYPNPTKGDINIALDLAARTNVKIELRNSIGQLVYAEEIGQLEQGKQNIILNNGSMTAGIYQLIIIVNNKLATETIIIK